MIRDMARQVAVSAVTANRCISQSRPFFLKETGCIFSQQRKGEHRYAQQANAIFAIEYLMLDDVLVDIFL